MKSPVYRFYVEPNLGERRGIELAFPRLADIARAEESNRVTVFSYSKDNLDGSELQDYFGQETIIPWQRSGSKSLVRFDGLLLPRIGSSTIYRATIRGLVLVLYPTREMLAKLDRQLQVTAVGRVGWYSLDDAKEWIVQWSAEPVLDEESNENQAQVR